MIDVWHLISHVVCIGAGFGAGWWLGRELLGAEIISALNGGGKKK